MDEDLSIVTRLVLAGWRLTERIELDVEKRWISIEVVAEKRELKLKCRWFVTEELIKAAAVGVIQYHKKHCYADILDQAAIADLVESVAV